MRIIRRYWVLALGAVLFAIAVAGFSARFGQVSFGWTAYAPLSSTTFTPSQPDGAWLLALAAAGLVLVAGWVGHAIGRRSRATPR